MIGEKRHSAVILDDHPLWLDAVESLLATASIDIVGKALTSEEALVLLDESDADLLISDLRLRQGASGAACVREALKRHPDLKVVVISEYDGPSSVEEALSSGAAAFVSKVAHPEDIVSAVRQVFSNSFFLAGAPRLSGRPGRQSDRLPGLTLREAEILELVSEGYTNGMVAKMLWVTEQTVKFHLSNIYRKLGVANRTEATHWVHLNAFHEGVRTRPSVAS